jgi:hypothetical protein
MCDSHSCASGIYRGVVVANNDPSGKGRVKVRIPQLLGKTPTDWAWPKETASVSVTPPKIGQGVWVMFEGGDTAFPVWVGTFGTTPADQKAPLLKPLDSGVDVSAAAPYLVFTTVGGASVLDVTATLVAVGNKLTNLEARVAAIEGMP